MPQIFPVATRNPGIVESGDKVVPAGAAGHKYFVHVTGMSQADLDNTDVKFDLRMYVKRNGVYPTIDPAIHNEDAGVPFNGGPNQGKNGTATPAPGFRVDGTELAGQTVKFWLNVTGGTSFNAGLDADAV